MKNKLLKLILALTLAVVTAVCAVACGEGNWKANVSLTNPGKVIKNGGFVIETENNVYFINGEESYTASNKLGTPVKGALMVVKKSELAEDKNNPETVVSKVISSSDYTAGIYLFGDKLYYATPSTKKDSNGNVANDYLEFCSSDLNGNSRTDYFYVNGNSTIYRFAEKDGEVFVIYYDSESSSIISYSTKTNKSQTIVENPASYKFMDNDAVASTDIVFIYTESVKSEATGNTESFNKVFTYSVGAESAVEALSGKKDNLDDITYALSFVDGENVFFTATPATSSDFVNTYSVNVKDIANSEKYKLYADSSLAASTNIFTDDAIYVLDSDGGFIVEYSGYADGKYAYKKNVAAVSASTLLFKDGNYIYYIDSETCLTRVDVTVADGGNEENVSTGKIVSDWYEVTLTGGYVFWLDASDEGLSYINYVATATQATAEDTDDDGKDDNWYLDGVKKLAVITDDDKVSIVAAKISALSSISKIAYEDGKFTDEETIKAARAAYDALDAKLQKKLADELEVLENYEEYLRVSKLLKALVDAENVEITAANKADYQAKIDEIKAAIKANNWSNPNNMLIENGMYAMQEIQKKIDNLSK